MGSFARIYSPEVETSLQKAEVTLAERMEDAACLSSLLSSGHDNDAEMRKTLREARVLLHRIEASVDFAEEIVGD